MFPAAIGLRSHARGHHRGLPRHDTSSRRPAETGDPIVACLQLLASTSYIGGMSQLKSSLRAPEGKWVAASERRATTNFSPDMPVALTWAELKDEGDSSSAKFLIFNTQQFLFICNPSSLDRVSGSWWASGTARDRAALAPGLAAGTLLPPPPPRRRCCCQSVLRP